MPTLNDIMSRDVFTVAGDTTVAEVAQAMLKGRVGSAIVMDGRFLAGIFTERDVVRAAASGRDLSTARVTDWMTPEPVTAPPDTDVDDAAAMMMGQGFRHLPVEDGNDLIGIVSLRDILRTRVRRVG
ncbi:MAG TPA: CBS domain-containing protein [Actinomycetota bacterium]|jgi:CBS domain-containing protein|nr:CBS domain-containing protein [Actinomycetota bacterium]